MHPGLESWRYFVIYAFNAFSIPLLIKTLLAPWKQDKDAGELGVLERVVFFIFSRILGLIARVILIILGLLFTIVAVISFPIFFFIPIKISREHFANMGSVGAELSYGSTFVLNKHGQDLMSDPRQKLFGKEKAVRMIERGLARAVNHNVLLVGDTGVGKTTTLGYLGRLAHSGLSDPSLRHHRVVSLLVEGMSETDFDTALHEAEHSGNVILVIENIHSYQALFTRLMSYLKAPHFNIIVTTDFSNYDRVLKQYPEFLAQFEKVDLFPPTQEETIAIITNTASGIRIGADAIVEIVRLADRLIGNQPEPAKSLAILDELRTLGKKITIEDVQEIVSDKTNMPVGTMSTDEGAVLRRLEQTMRQKIVGQDQAVQDVSQALVRLRTGVSDPKKPAGSFLFLGPTGVGKTQTAKVLAESYFGRQNAMIRFDMSEFALPENVEILKERLATAIEETPLALVFFDELEKADHRVHNLLLQVLDEGRLTRGDGREANFKNAIIIATSNAGSALLVANPLIEKKALIDELIRNNIFAPEFLNRFNDIVLFKPLSQAQAKEITKLMLSEFAERLYADKKITLDITEALIGKVSTAGFDPEFGARPIKRAMEEIVENKVAEYVMAGNTGGKLTIV